MLPATVSVVKETPGNYELFYEEKYKGFNKGPWRVETMSNDRFSIVHVLRHGAMFDFSQERPHLTLTDLLAMFDIYL